MIFLMEYVGETMDLEKLILFQNNQELNKEFTLQTKKTIAKGVA